MGGSSCRYCWEQKYSVCIPFIFYNNYHFYSFIHFFLSFFLCFFLSFFLSFLIYFSFIIILILIILNTLLFHILILIFFIISSPSPLLFFRVVDDGSTSVTTLRVLKTLQESDVTVVPHEGPFSEKGLFLSKVDIYIYYKYMLCNLL